MRPKYMGETAKNSRAAFHGQPALELHIPIVLARARAMMQRHLPQGSLISLCDARLGMLEGDIRRQGHAPCMDVPYFLCRGLGGDDESSLAAGALSAFIYLGCDILDDLHDGELPAGRTGLSPAHASLAASILLHTLPVLAMAELFDSSDQMGFAACRLLAETLQPMAAGQARDIESRFNADSCVEEAEAIVAAKSGEEMALFCGLGAILAGRDDLAQKGVALFGRSLGSALQIASDISDIFEDESSNDLEVGTFTIPLALHFLRLEGKQQISFRRTWQESGRDQKARRLLQAALKDSGALAHSALMIEGHCERAREALKALPLEQGPRIRLEGFVEGLSGCAIIPLRSFLNMEGAKGPALRLMGM